MIADQHHTEPELGDRRAEPPRDGVSGRGSRRETQQELQAITGTETMAQHIGTGTNISNCIALYLISLCCKWEFQAKYSPLS